MMKRVTQSLAVGFFPPGAVFVAIARHMEQRVNGRGSAQRLVTRSVNPATGDTLLRNGLVVPVVGTLEQEVDRRRNADLIRVVGRPGLDEEHPRGRVLGEPRREHAAGATGPDDDVVVHSDLPETKSGQSVSPYSPGT